MSRSVALNRRGARFARRAIACAHPRVRPAMHAEGWATGAVSLSQAGRGCARSRLPRIGRRAARPARRPRRSPPPPHPPHGSEGPRRGLGTPPHPAGVLRRGWRAPPPAAASYRYGSRQRYRPWPVPPRRRAVPRHRLHDAGAVDHHRRHPVPAPGAGLDRGVDRVLRKCRVDAALRIEARRRRLRQGGGAAEQHGGGQDGAGHGLVSRRMSAQ
jgi:hypothetical protein